MLSEWAKAVRKTARGRLVIHHRTGDDCWLDLVVAYWEGMLPDAQPVPSSKFARVHRRGNLYFKRYLVRDWRDAVKNVFRASRARRALESGMMVASLGFHIPQPVCLIEGHGQSALLTEAIADAPNVRDWLNKPEFGVAACRPRKRTLLRALAQEVAAWHNAGLHHADMRVGNILCRAEGGRWTLFWLDNEAVRHYARLPESQRVHNLMQINMEQFGVSLTDRLFFWKCYAAKAGISAAAGRRIIRRVMRYTQRRWRQRGWLK